MPLTLPYILLLQQFTQDLTWFNVTFKISEIGGETTHYFAYMLKIGVRLSVTSNAIPPASR